MFEGLPRKVVACLSGTFFQRLCPPSGAGEGSCQSLGDLVELFPPLRHGLGMSVGSWIHLWLLPSLRPGRGWHGASRVGAHHTCVGSQLNVSSICHCRGSPIFGSFLSSSDGWAPALGQAWVPWTQRGLENSWAIENLVKCQCVIKGGGVVSRGGQRREAAEEVFGRR